MRIYEKPDIHFTQITNENNIASSGLNQWLEGNELNSTDGITVFQYDLNS